MTIISAITGDAGGFGGSVGKDGADAGGFVQLEPGTRSAGV